jgi:hypothetical protein
MFGFVNAAHAAAAQLIENTILVQEESVGPANQKSFRLKFGQQSFLYERAGEVFALGVFWKAIGHCRQLFRADESTLADVVQK